MPLSATYRSGPPSSSKGSDAGGQPDESAVYNVDRFNTVTEFLKRTPTLSARVCAYICILMTSCCVRRPPRVSAEASFSALF